MPFSTFVSPFITREKDKKNFKLNDKNLNAEELATFEASTLE